MDAAELQVEIVFATAEEQLLLEVTVASGATIADVIEKSKLAERLPEYDLDSLEVGVWGHPADRGQAVTDGDRIEIYRPLCADPREARRRLAALGQTMGGVPATKGRG